MAKKSFITSFGREIPFQDGYLEAHPYTNPVPSRYLEYKTPAPAKDQRVGFHMFLKDYYEYSLMMDFLDGLGMGRGFSSALDIGGQEATISKLLKAEGRSVETTCIELKNFSALLPEDLFYKYFVQIKGSILAGEVTRFADSMLKLHTSTFGYHPPEGSQFFRTELKRRPVEDRYLVGDFYELDATFDLVTSFLSMDYFDIGRLFAKTASLLEEGGVFCFMYGYWWWPVNPTLLVGRFPYACQRLTLDDLQRYYEQHHPDMADRVAPLYNYYHQGRYRPTLGELIELARKNNLWLLGSKRLHPIRDNHATTPLTPQRLERRHPGILTDVLEDIRQFRSDVQLEDLQTFVLMAAFRKMSPEKGEG